MTQFINLFKQCRLKEPAIWFSGAVIYVQMVLTNSLPNREGKMFMKIYERGNLLFPLNPLLVGKNNAHMTNG